MARRSTSPVVVIAAVAIVAAAALLAAGALGLAGGSVTVTEGPAVVVPPGSHDGPTVISAHESPPAFSIFGLNFGGSRYAVHVGFFPPPGCEPGDDNRIEPEGPCAGIPVSGEVTGGGTLPNGEEFLIVGLRVGRECYEASVTGDPWPAHPSCPA